MVLKPYEYGRSPPSYHDGSRYDKSMRNNGGMLPSHHENEMTTKKSSKKKKVTLMMIPVMAIVMLNHEWIAIKGRELTMQCIHNVYAWNVQMMLDMPAPPVKDPAAVPSYIQLCQEWIRQSVDDNYESGVVIEEHDNVCMDWTSPHYSTLEIFAAQLVDRLAPKGKYKHNCFKTRTWDEAIFGFDRTTVQQNLPVADVSPKRYLQQDVVTNRMMLEQCKICVYGYDQTLENTRVPAYATHHCLLFPEQFGPFNNTRVNGMTFYSDSFERDIYWNETILNETAWEDAPNLGDVPEGGGDPAAATIVRRHRRLTEQRQLQKRREDFFEPDAFDEPGFHEDEEEEQHFRRTAETLTRLRAPKEARRPNVVPGTTIANQLRARLRYLGLTWSKVTNVPPKETTRGTVIFVDIATTPIPPEHIIGVPQRHRSITVVAGPLCGVTNMRVTGQPCMEYVQDIVNHFKFHPDQNRTYSPYVDYTNTGSDGGHGIDFRIMTSTAAMWSRLIMADRLICLPYSPNCFLPMMAKRKGTVGIFLEQAGWHKAWHFFTFMGTWGYVRVYELPDAAIPEEVEGRRVRQLDASLMTTSAGQPVASIFDRIYDVVSPKDGFTSHIPAALMSAPDMELKSNEEVLSKAYQRGIKNSENNPKGVKKEGVSWVEKVPSKQEVEQAVADGVPLNVNYFPDAPNRQATNELGLDVDIGIGGQRLKHSDFRGMIQEHRQSEIRIVEETNAAKERQFAAVTNGNFPPSMEMEVYCPTDLDDGRTAVYEHGSVEIESRNGNDIIVSDGVGTIKMRTEGMTKEEIDIQYDADGNPVNSITDPDTGGVVTIIGQSMQMNQDNGVPLIDPAGVIVVDSTGNHNGTIITEGGTGTVQHMGKQTKYTGSFVSAGANRVDQDTPIRYGRGYALNTLMDPGTQRTVAGPFKGFMEDSSISSSDSGGSGYKGYKEEPEDPKAPSSSDEGGLTSDSRDQGIDERLNREVDVQRGLQGAPERRQISLKPPRTDGRFNSASSSSEFSSDEIRRARMNESSNKSQIMIKVPADEFKFGGLNENELQKLCNKYSDRVEAARKRTRVFGQIPGMHTQDQQEEQVEMVDIQNSPPQRRRLTLDN